MYLKEMKKLFKLIILLIFPLCIYGQINTFNNGENILFSHNFLNETTSYGSDTTQQISIGPRIFGVSSTSSNRTYNSYVLGANLSANIPRGGLVKATAKADIAIPMLHTPLLDRVNPAMEIWLPKERSKRNTK